ncbi:MAG: hypothetical protein IPK32_15545 [Verrucomicrobiaceae bacterium]|nr:hypothetical protein [Verrucomicrobiaceae bacterium]
MTRQQLIQGSMRQGGEIAVIVLLAAVLQWLWPQGFLSMQGFCLLVLGLALAKTVFFFVENLTHILLATRNNMPYHRVLGLMGVNMVQITLSFAFDFWCLRRRMRPTSAPSMRNGAARSRSLSSSF